MTDIEEILTDLAASASQVEGLRRATKPETTPLAPGMASILGKVTRQRIPFLSVALEALVSKLFVKAISTEKVSTTKAISSWLSAAGWGLLERKLWEGALRDGRAFLLVTYTDKPKLTLRQAYNGTEGAALLKDGSTVNVYSLGSGKCADVFFPDRIEKFQLDTRTGRWLPRRDTEGEPWPLPWRASNGEPLGLALIPFGEGVSTIGDALQTQADLNEALLDLGAVSRSQGWPQRYLSGETGGGLLKNVHGQAVRDAQGNPLRREMKLEPGSLLRLEGDNAKLGQLTAASLDRTAVDVHLGVLSLITGVPSHYFTGNWPSGVALLRAETRLDTRVEHLQGVFTPSLVAAVELVFALEEIYGAGGSAPKAIAVEWYPPQVETEDLKMERAQGVIELYTAGLYSLEVALKELHPDWSEEQIAGEVARLRPTPVAETIPLNSDGSDTRED